MTPKQARLIAEVMNAAAEEAERNNAPEVNVLDQLRSLDDAARQELDAAIKAAGG